MGEDLMELINYFRVQPEGYYGYGIDYGYGDETTVAQSLYPAKILTLWKKESEWAEMVADFRQYLISRYAEHDDNDEPIMEGLILEDAIKKSPYEYTITLIIADLTPLEYDAYDWNDDNSGTVNTIEWKVTPVISIEDNARRIKLFDELFLSPKTAGRIRHISLAMHDFYFSTFNTEEELNNKITNQD